MKMDANDPGRGGGGLQNKAEHQAAHDARSLLRSPGLPAGPASLAVNRETPLAGPCLEVLMTMWMQVGHLFRQASLDRFTISPRVKE